MGQNCYHLSFDSNSAEYQFNLAFGDPDENGHILAALPYGFAFEGETGKFSGRPPRDVWQPEVDVQRLGTATYHQCIVLYCV